jgi:hypothetical protein
MIEFKQKEFWIGPALTVGTGLLGMGQASAQAKESEEQAEKTQELLRNQNKKLEKIAKEAKNSPEAAGQAAQVLQQKAYALPIALARTLVKGRQLAQAAMNTEAGKVVTEVGKAGKDAFGKGLVRNTVGGVGMGVAAYGAGKYIQKDMKKEGLEVDENGNLGQKSYAIPMALARTLVKGRQIAEPLLKSGKDIVSNNPKTMSAMKVGAGGLATGAAFVGVPTVLGYHADKKQTKDQIDATQKQFAFVPTALLNFGKGMAQKEIVKNPGKTLLGFGSSLASFGAMGRESVGKFATNMMNSNNQTVQKMGKALLSKDSAGNLIKGTGKYEGQYMANKKAMAGAIGAGALATKATWDAGEKITNKIGRTVDPEAYKYQDSKNQQIQ